MKIIVTGSLGNISKPLTKKLVQNGDSVTVISSKADKQKDIENLGALAAVGSLEDANFLAATFAGADAVYCMVPPNYHYGNIDPIDFYRNIGVNYLQAIRQADVKKVVHLSGIGAHLKSGSGQIRGHREVETIFSELPEAVVVTTLRPVAFYGNLLNFIPVIKKADVMASNYGGSDVIPWVSPVDIAMAAAEELTAGTGQRRVRYIVSDELSCNEASAILGTAIGKPDLKWVVVSEEDVFNRMKNAGIPEKYGKLLAEMNTAMHNGTLLEDYHKNRPALYGSVKMTDFAQNFAVAYYSHNK